MAKPAEPKIAAKSELEAAFAALEGSLEEILPAAKGAGAAAIDNAREDLSASIARLREAVGKV